MTASEYNLVKAFYSVNETTELLSISRTSLYELVKRRELTPAKLGKKTLFYATDLAALLTKLREPEAIAHLQGQSEPQWPEQCRAASMRAANADQTEDRTREAERARPSALTPE